MEHFWPWHFKFQSNYVWSRKVSLQIGTPNGLKCAPKHLLEEHLWSLNNWHFKSNLTSDPSHSLCHAASDLTLSLMSSCDQIHLSRNHDGWGLNLGLLWASSTSALSCLHFDPSHSLCKPSSDLTRDKKKKKVSVQISTNQLEMARNMLLNTFWREILAPTLCMPASEITVTKDPQMVTKQLSLSTAPYQKANSNPVLQHGTLLRNLLGQISTSKDPKKCQSTPDETCSYTLWQWLREHLPLYGPVRTRVGKYILCYLT